MTSPGRQLWSESRNWGETLTKVYEERLHNFQTLQDREEALGLRLGWVRAGTFVAGSLFYLGFDLLSGALALASGVGMGLASMALGLWGHGGLVAER